MIEKSVHFIRPAQFSRGRIRTVRAPLLLLVLAVLTLHLRAGELDLVPPRPVSQPYPLYPRSMKEKGVEGAAIISFVIGINGRVQEAWPVAYTNEAFAKTSVDSVEAWRFTPAMKGGKPVPKNLSVPQFYTLQPESANAIEDFCAILQSLQSSLDRFFRALVRQQLHLPDHGWATVRSNHLIWFRLSGAPDNNSIAVSVLYPSINDASERMRNDIEQVLVRHPLPASFLKVLGSLHESFIAEPDIAYLATVPAASAAQ